MEISDLRTEREFLLKISQYSLVIENLFNELQRVKQENDGLRAENAALKMQPKRPDDLED